MTQDSSRRPTRRGARAGRNRPELVTPMEEVKSGSPVPETNQPIEETLSALAEQSIAPPSRTRRLANFFSTVGRGEKTPEAEQAKASTPARPAPARPASAFKTKYLLGMLIYLFGAQFIGTYERAFLMQNHLNSVITKFPLFGATIIIDPSTLPFLA